MYKTKYLSQNQSIESTEGFEFIFGKKDIDLESFYKHLFSLIRIPV